MRAHYEFDTVLLPTAVVGALTDFSERRPDLWPNLDPAKYQVHERGDTWAVVTEGSPRPDVWSRERYDWSIPGRVSWTVEESNFCAPGSGMVASVTPGGKGGSHVAIDWERIPTSPKGYLVAVVVRLAKDRVLGLRATLDKMARTTGEGQHQGG